MTRMDARLSPAALARRIAVPLVAVGLLASAASAADLRPFIQGSMTIQIPAQREPTAGHWQTWFASSMQNLRPPAPPSRSSSQGIAEVRELLQLQSQRSQATQDLVRFWDAQGGLPRWSEILLAKIQETGTNPVRAARALGLFYTALADATTHTWDAKYSYNRLCPPILVPQLVYTSANDSALPSYPSEHAAIATAAAAVLDYLYPHQTALVHGQRMSFDAIADEAATSRLWAGSNYRSDLSAGQEIGMLIGAQAVARGENDGSSALWDKTSQPGRLFGPQYWVPTPPAFIFPPLEPLAGTWKTWLMTSGSQFRPGPPPALQGTFPSASFIAEASEVKQTVASLTPDQHQIALFWADNPGVSPTPPGHWARIATQEVVGASLSTPRAARALALVGATLADCAIACWDAKYTYWVLRPITAIRTLKGQPFYDPNFQTVITTPPFPSYTSGHSTFSGGAAAVLSYLFPGGKVQDALGNSIAFNDGAEQAALSRLYAGIHYRSDNEEGLICGRQVANLAIKRAESDGAPGP